ncbi:hypothetical protein AQUCO_04500196v1 [Aquilegia coerulea]|uniref:GTP cyclohydrolase 1 n=1 Tax=Aquilegia coerulea TaxID=218851 RepID=A0A2G5CMB8_AQUCA|nr:hypothetical protein AQUCO_04500196v1 [Aquilegia coerulea]PIA32426.1 hypothetical protein AQUCO_04500196v1 [Aquilegia coerulea]
MGALNDGHFNGHLENNNGLILNLSSPNKEVKQDSVPISDIQNAVKILLQGLGEDSNRQGLIKTPLRVAKALCEGTRGYRQKVKDIVQGALFPEAGLDGGVGHAGGAGGLVVVRDLDLFSYCECCLLPFRVKCHVGYVPSGQRVVGLSKLSRVADVFAKRLQDPQRLADEICSALHNGIRPAGVGVVLQCWHIQLPVIEWNCSGQINHPTVVDMQGWSKISVCAGSGVFESENGDVWCDFRALLKLRGVKVDKVHIKSSSSQGWCPSRSLDVLAINGHENTQNPMNCKISSKAEPGVASMIAAVGAILHSLGEDPSRKELVGTPHRFVQWLMNFNSSNVEMNLNGFGLEGMSQIKCRSQRNEDREYANCKRDELRSELNFPFWSQCEHHLLPFHGAVHIGYFHNEGMKPIGRSILQSIVHFHGWKLQVQERLSRQIVETVSSVFGGDVMVVVEANHICMISRGIEKVGSSTATIATMGRFSSDSTAKEMFLQTVSESGDASGG